NGIYPFLDKTQLDLLNKSSIQNEEQLLNLVNEIYTNLGLQKIEKYSPLTNLTQILRHIQSTNQKHSQNYINFQNRIRDLENSLDNISKQYDFFRKSIFELFQKYSIPVEDDKSGEYNDP